MEKFPRKLYALSAGEENPPDEVQQILGPFPPFLSVGTPCKATLALTVCEQFEQLLHISLLE